MSFAPFVPYRAHTLLSQVSFVSQKVSWDLYGCDVRDTDCVAVIGTFDGVHLGHQSLIEAALAEAHERSVPAVAITFTPHPRTVFTPDKDNLLLLSDHDRIAALLEAGLDCVIAFRFTHNFAALTPVSFFEDALIGAVRPISLYVGENFSFGQGGQGTVSTLKELAGQKGVEVNVVRLLEMDNQVVSSTRIRTLVSEGRVCEAERLLGRPHYVRGRIIHGRGEGASFGFPTANVACDKDLVMPREGVYATYVVIDEHFWPAATNVGQPPTFVSSATYPSFLEANLIGFEGDAYGADVVVEFSEWLRASRPFDSLEELEATVLGNIDWVRTNLREGGMLPCR